MQCVVKNVIGGILALEDISEEETHQLHHLLELIATRVPCLWGSPEPSDAHLHDPLKKQSQGAAVSEDNPSLRKGSPTSTTASMAHLSEYIASWRKYVQVMEVLEASLVSISERWARHEWLFDPLEMRSLVTALFTNTDRRAKFLEALH